MELAKRVALFQAGDEGASREIYERHAPPARCFAARYAREREEIDDAAQEAFETTT
ncbi:MAG: hypothetical protein LBP56_06150 [Odoribacteraceae bacterium]|jgi:DNA-directed RNA polymerase specialized sigma24 family protein|nr:hypothetical protein [Odoribacteraceae bacterium]